MLLARLLTQPIKVELATIILAAASLLPLLTHQLAQHQLLIQLLVNSLVKPLKLLLLAFHLLLLVDSLAQQLDHLLALSVSFLLNKGQHHYSHLTVALIF